MAIPCYGGTLLGFSCPGEPVEIHKHPVAIPHRECEPEWQHDVNIGPRANGDVPYEIENRLLEMGDWLSVNGESIYGSQAFDLVKDQHDWGKITCKEFADGTTRLYLHLYNWPLNHQLPVTGIKDPPARAYMLADKLEAPLAVDHQQVFTRIGLPPLAPGPYVSVVVLEYDHFPAIEDGLVAKSVYGGYALQPGNATTLDGNQDIVKTSGRGWKPTHIHVSEPSSYTWRIFVEEPLSMRTDVSYNYQGKPGKGELVVISSENRISGYLQTTQIFVGEPNENFRTGDFRSHRLGELNFPNPGIYDIRLEIKPWKRRRDGFPVGLGRMNGFDCTNSVIMK